MIKKAFFEAAFVVLGVVLALIANGWRESRAEQAAADAALAAIHEEVAANREAVAQSIAAHQTRLEAIGDPRTDTPLDMSAFGDGFVKPAATLSHAAWDSASETGALAHMEFETVRRLGGLYAHQERYSEQVTSYSALIYETLFDDGYMGIIGNKPGLMSMISTLQYQERGLLSAYDGYLETGPSAD